MNDNLCKLYYVPHETEEYPDVQYSIDAVTVPAQKPSFSYGTHLASECGDIYMPEAV